MAKHMKAVAAAFRDFKFVPDVEYHTDAYYLYASSETGTYEEIAERARRLEVWLNIYKVRHPGCDILTKVEFKVLEKEQMLPYLQKLTSCVGFGKREAAAIANVSCDIET